LKKARSALAHYVACPVDGTGFQEQQHQSARAIQLHNEREASESGLTRPLLMLQIFRSVVDDPVARAAPAPADIIDRPNSIVAPN
jgi:hypothetical protein